jgi:chaperonin GroES
MGLRCSPTLGARLLRNSTDKKTRSGTPGGSASQENTMKIRPLHDRIVIQRVAEEEKTAGGLFIPDTAKEKPARGVVVSVGEGKRDDAGKRIPLDVSAGDEILFGKYVGTELKLDGEEHIVLREDEVLAVIAK